MAFVWNSEEIKDRIDDFLDPLLDYSLLDLDYEIEDGEAGSELISPDLTVKFEGDDLDILLAHRGELLMALEQLTLEALHIPHEDRYRLLFDANDYRIMRIEELRLSAETAAEKVKKNGRPFHFQPMTSRERRILHLALRDIEGVTSGSEGVAPHRHTVVKPE